MALDDGYERGLEVGVGVDAVHLRRFHQLYGVHFIYE